MVDGYGTWIEQVVREIAAGAGVPDFVFRAEVVTKGGGQREIGDALLWVGRQLVVVSIKSRDPDIEHETSERRDRWLAKNIAKAVRQINGTVRTLRSPPEGLRLRSERGVSILWRPDLVDETSAVRSAGPQLGDRRERRVVMVSKRFSWRLEERMHERGIHQITALQRELAGHGIDLSSSQIHRLVTQTPERLNLEVLAALCEILACSPAELIGVHTTASGRRTADGTKIVDMAATVRPRRARVARPIDKR